MHTGVNFKMHPTNNSESLSSGGITRNSCLVIKCCSDIIAQHLLVLGFWLLAYNKYRRNNFCLAQLVGFVGQRNAKSAGARTQRYLRNFNSAVSVSICLYGCPKFCAACLFNKSFHIVAQGRQINLSPSPSTDRAHCQTPLNSVASDDGYCHVVSVRKRNMPRSNTLLTGNLCSPTCDY